MHKKIKKAFTLVELMVIIALIAIVYLWMTWINFNKLSNEQKSEIFANKIISILEEQRDNSLTWKWIYDSVNSKFIEVSKRSVEISTWENFEIISKADWTQTWKVTKSEKQKIEKISCWTSDIPWNAIINFENEKISFNNCKENLKIQVDFNWAKNEVEIDKISWLIKKCKNFCN